MSHIKDLIGQIEIGTAVASGRLVMSPLIARQPAQADYLTLDEALSCGAADVGEVSEQGQVPELLFRNRSDRPVLLLDGEELVGAKQNRIRDASRCVPRVRLSVVASLRPMLPASSDSHGMILRAVCGGSDEALR